MNNVGDQVAKTVESAKEAAAKMGEQVSDFFQGNPFSTAVGRKIEQATDASTLATENWGLNMEICDFINSSEEMARDAVRAIKKRLHSNMSKNNAIVMYTLTVLETTVKNCGHHYLVLVMQKDFILDLVKLIGPKFDAPQVIQERVLSLIQAWTDAFKGQPDLIGVRQVYEDLRSKGVEFPASDLDALAPIVTPKRTVQPPAGPLHQPLQQTYDVVAADGGPIVASPEQLQKLRNDLDKVNTNIKVFREMITTAVPGKESVDELQLMSELYTACKQMQTRILDLINTVSNEEVTSELLVVNDDFNSLFEKYERFTANRSGASAEAATAPQSGAADLISFGNEGAVPVSQQLANMKVSSGVSYDANNERQAAVGLATAVAQRTGDLPPTDEEAAEMRQWLEQQKKLDPENDKL